MTIPDLRRSLLVLLTGLTAPCLWAAEPSVRTLNVRGLQAGGTTALVIDGDDLGTTPRLLLDFPAKQTLKPGGNDRRAAFDVSLDEVPAGYYQLRVVSDGGVSLPVVVAIDRLPQVVRRVL